MKQYQLKLENTLGNSLIATFNDVKDLIKHMDDNPPPHKYHYYMVVVETTKTRVDPKSIRKFYK